MAMRARAPVTPADSTWAIVLAGHRHGRGRAACANQSAPAPRRGDRRARPPLTETLASVTRLVPPDRVVVVTTRARASPLLRRVIEAIGSHLLLEPADHGTATELLLPALWIACREPGATVMVLGTETPAAQNTRLWTQLSDVAALLEPCPERIVLFGAVPANAATDCGWIEPGELLSRAGTVPVRAVRRFLEQPSEAVAHACFASGWLWNTSALVARASALADTARRCCPSLYEHWREHLGSAAIEGAPGVVDVGLTSAPRIDFARSVLEAPPTGLAVVALQATPRTHGHVPPPLPRDPWIPLRWLLRPGYAM